MKKIFFILALGIITSAVVAQDSNIVTMKSDTTGKLNNKDYLGMRIGTMMVYKSGDSIAMTSVITLNDGTVIKQDGSYTRKNGSIGKLKDGETIYMDGTIRSRNRATINRKD